MHRLHRKASSPPSLACQPSPEALSSARSSSAPFLAAASLKPRELNIMPQQLEPRPCSHSQMQCKLSQYGAQHRSVAVQAAILGGTEAAAAHEGREQDEEAVPRLVLDSNIHPMCIALH